LKRIISKLTRSFRKGEKGFTLIELLIVIAILGIIAAIVIPNAAGFMISGKLNAANTEVQNVKTAATGYMGEHNGVWTDTSDDLTPYLAGALKATYTFNTTTGALLTGTDNATNYTGLTFYPGTQMWERTHAAP
jgi:type IV pilus assembly protein PilA